MTDDERAEYDRLIRRSLNQCMSDTENGRLSFLGKLSVIEKNNKSFSYEWDIEKFKEDQNGQA